MAGRFCEGFDAIGSASQAGSITTTGGGSISVITGRNSIGQRISLSSGAGSSALINMPFDGFTGTTVYLGFALFLSGTVDNQVNGAVFRLDTSSGTAIFTLGVTSGGTITLRSGAGNGTLRFTSTGSIAFNTDVYIEAVIVLSTTTTGSVEIFINGTSAGSTSDIITAGTATAPGAVSFRLHAVTLTFRVDDVYVLDSATPGPNSRLGDVRVAAAMPVADTATADFVRNTGDFDFEAIDEIPPDEDTTYVASDVPGARSLYLHSMPADKVVYFARQQIRARKEDAGGSNPVLVARSGTEEQVSGELGVSTVYTYVSQYIQEDPDTNDQLTSAIVNAMEFGFELPS